MEVLDNHPLFTVDYLTDASKEAFKRDLKDFYNEGTFKSSPFQHVTQEYLMQGDILKDISLPQWDVKKQTFTTHHKSDSKYLLLSNTCDIDLANPRVLPVNCILAPLVSIKKYTDKLLSIGKSADYVANIKTSLHQNTITDKLYLPINDCGQYDPHGDGYIAILDAIFHIPRTCLSENNRIISMTQFMHYLLTFKLSFHFCRLHEKIDRHSS